MYYKYTHDSNKYNEIKKYIISSLDVEKYKLILAHIIKFIRYDTPRDSSCIIELADVLLKIDNKDIFLSVANDKLDTLEYIKNGMNLVNF